MDQSWFNKRCHPKKRLPLAYFLDCHSCSLALALSSSLSALCINRLFVIFAVEGKMGFTKSKCGQSLSDLSVSFVFFLLFEVY